MTILSSVLLGTCSGQPPGPTPHFPTQSTPEAPIGYRSISDNNRRLINCTSEYGTRAPHSYKQEATSKVTLLPVAPATPTLTISRFCPLRADSSTLHLLPETSPQVKMRVIGAFSLAAIFSGVLALPHAQPVPSRALRNEMEETDLLLFDTSIDRFRLHMRREDPPEFEWSTPGCDHIEDHPYIFRHACMRWQWGVQQYTAQGRLTEEARTRLDDQYEKDVRRKCYIMIPMESCRDDMEAWPEYFRAAEIEFIMGWTLDLTECRCMRFVWT
ncbi:hypothetical protein ACRALDRAFT_211380 [Sodiomyces alcalophilus JCM 7366]|uniref:uncharacterized protein n=1 Tax=Sodiomyces alcalophilus JCM 7366 TaxID=591952 RepID=UPI0039B57148